MNFRDAIRRLSGNRAAKRPSWKGYILRTDTETDAETQEVKAYKLTFVYADGTHSVDYVFDSDSANDVRKDGSAVKVDAATTGTAFTNYAPLTQFLLEAMLADDWDVFDKSAVESAAAGTNEF